LAIASLVLGIIPCFLITSILAIVFGFIARNQIEQSGGTQQGAGWRWPASSSASCGSGSA
jgi:hypothetical protein